MNTWKRGRKRKQRPKLQETIRVLVVDDDQEIRDILRERLFIEGFQVVTADSGEEALAKFLVHQGTPEAFDVVTLDIRMCDLSGKQVLSLLRKIDQRVCVLMISGLDDLSQAVQSLSQGADDYLSKPIKIWDLRDRLVTALGRRASLVQREVRKQARAATGEDSRCANRSEARVQAERQGGKGSGDSDPMSDSGFGVEWGTAFSPSERLDSMDSSESPDADRPSSNICRKQGPVAEDADSPEDSISEPASSLRGFAGRGKPASEGAELIPPNQKMGRENDPGNRNDECGTGENRTPDPRTRDRGGRGAEDPKADRRASARKSEPREGRRPGSLSEDESTESTPTAAPTAASEAASEAVSGSASAGKTPLERTLELAQRVESSWEGCEGHGAQVAKLLEKLGASLATTLELSYEDLDGLCLAARLHGLGIQDRLDEHSREWALPLEDGSLEEGQNEAQSTLPGRDREDASIVARILHALLEEEDRKAASQAGLRTAKHHHRGAMSISLALLGRQGRRQQEVRNLDPALRNLLRDHEEEDEVEDKGQVIAAEEKGSPPVDSNLSDQQIEKLLALYEVADSWVHLTHEGMGGLSPARAFPELCASLTSSLPAHPTSMALAYLRTQIRGAAQ